MIIPLELRGYVEGHQRRLPEFLERLRAETSALPDGGMLLSRDSAALIGFVVRAIGARRALEIGTFTGFSSIVIASALQADGKLIALDRSKEWTAIARRYWREAGLEARIELRLGEAAESLAALLGEGARGSFDFALVDADKGAYPRYFELCLDLLRDGGLVAFDNTLWGGRVADESVHDADTEAIRALNRLVRDDPRVESCLLAIGDGLTLARKRPV